MKTLLVCHHDAPLHRLGMARWLGSFSDLSGIVEIHESRDRLRLAAADRAWEQREVARLCAVYPPSPPDVPIHVTSDPNSPATAAFIRDVAPDLMLAACKIILRKEVFTLPPSGTYVVHPGICPEYRNAHGCFWALANDDMHNVGATLLRIDAGVDTGPVYAHFRYDYDALRESPFVIQTRVVFENLDAIRLAMLDAATGRSQPLDTSRRPSAAWGQPWLTRYLRWKQRARKRHRESAVAALS